MTNYDFKLVIPKTKQPKQKTLYTPSTNAPAKKPVAIFCYSMMREEIRGTLSNDELYELEHLYDEANKEDLYGNKFTNGGMEDNVLNENEQKNFLQNLKENHNKFFEIVSKYIEKLKSKSDEEKIVNNLSLIMYNVPHSIYDALQYKYILEDLNNQNWRTVYNASFGNLPLLLNQLYENAKQRTEVKLHKEFDINLYFPNGEQPTEDEIQEAKEHFENMQNEYRQEINSGINDLKIIKEKVLNYANYVIEQAHKYNIYSADYEKVLQTAIANNDIKNLSIYTQRLSDRVFMYSDRNSKTIPPSKRAIELIDANGKIDTTFVQGITGDCWFLSALASMCSNAEILEKINNMITVNKEDDVIKSITVKIQGKDYTVDYENLKNANEYATGDLDVRALEMAVNQYVHENNLLNGDITLGGFANYAYEILFGKDNLDICDYEENDDYGYAEFNAKKYINYLKENKNYRILSNISTPADNLCNKECYALDENGKQIQVPTQHVFQYLGIDNNFYYFTDPHVPDRKLHIAISDFAKTFNKAVIIKFKNNEEPASLSY